MHKLNEKAVDKVESYLKQAIPSKRSYNPSLHFAPPTGWLNDPNGLVYYKGQYHLFYQWNPYQPVWGPMHWGHAVSDDLLHWSHLPVALVPDEPYEAGSQGGCFSGSAIEHDGKLYLIYTASSQQDGQPIQVQCVAYSDDGVHFEKYPGNPVLTAPAPYDSHAFRDPKIWRHNGQFYMVCGAQHGDRGAALLFSSPDLFYWHFINCMACSDDVMGSMWECPDFFHLGEWDYLLFSPVDSSVHQNMYLSGRLDYHTGVFIWNTSGVLDWGMDFYAPQSFCDAGGRRIVIAWANRWEWMPWWKNWGPTAQQGWCGVMNIPRQLIACADGRLAAPPVRELMQAAWLLSRRSGLIVSPDDGLAMSAIPDGSAFMMRLSININASTADELLCRLFDTGAYYTDLRFSLQQKTLCIDMNHSDAWSYGCVECSFPQAASLDVMILFDGLLLEVFLNEGEVCLSNRIYPAPGLRQDRFCAIGGILCLDEISVYDFAVEVKSSLE